MSLNWTTFMLWADSLIHSRWVEAVYVFLIILAVLVCNAILRRVLALLENRADGAGHHWQRSLLVAINPPSRGIVWVVGLTIAVGILTQGSESSLLLELFPPARDVAAISLVAWFALRMVTRAEQSLHAVAFREGRTLDPTAADAIGKLVRIAIFTTAALVIMQALGFSIAGIVTLGGVGGIAIGFAAQSLVANLVGGLTVYASRPFKVGEWIIISGTDVMGEVQHIGWRATCIMGFDRRPFYVPNSLFNTGVVINHSRMTNRRIMEHLHLRYRDIDKVREIVAAVNRMLAEHPGVEHDFFAFNFDTCGDFAIKLFLYAFTQSTDYNEFMNVKEDVLLKIATIVREHDAELAVPTSTVYMPEGLQLGDARKADAEPLIDSLVTRAS